MNRYVLVLGSLTLASTAVAATPNYGYEELGNRQVTVQCPAGVVGDGTRSDPANATFDGTDKECPANVLTLKCNGDGTGVVKPAAGADLTKCQAFWRQTPTDTVTLKTVVAKFTVAAQTVALTLAPRVEAWSAAPDVTVSQAQKTDKTPGDVTANGLKQGEKLFGFFVLANDSRWLQLGTDASMTKVTVPDGLSGQLPDVFTSAVLRADGTYATGQIKVAKTGVVDSANPPQTPTGNGKTINRKNQLASHSGKALPNGTASMSPELDPYFLDCKPPPGFSDEFVVCYDAYDLAVKGSRPSLTGLPEGHVLKPNRSIVVMVRHSEQVGVDVSLDGTSGVYEAPYQNLSGSDLTVHAKLQGAQGGNPQSLITIKSFAPRLPGNLNLKVETFTEDAAGNDTTVGTESTELIVDKTYGGVFRVGFGMVFFGGIDRNFAARKAPQSGQSEIVATNNGVLDMELVLGFAPYLDYFWGGRSYIDGNNLKKFPWGLSPYVGIGVLTVNQSGGVDGFKSLYLGVEWEPIPYFSVALTWVGRRVTQLSQGAVLGGPTVDGSVPTQQGFANGFGVVVNVSPDFLRLATNKNSSLFPK